MGKLKEAALNETPSARPTPKPTPATPRAAPEKFTYALKSYVVEIRKAGWYIAEQWFTTANEKPKWTGPFSSIEDAAIAIARRHAIEIADRQTMTARAHKLKPGQPLYGLKGPLGLPRRSSKTQGKEATL